MAIYHCRFKVHTRGHGATAARSAAYRSGTRVAADGTKIIMPVRGEAARKTSAVRSAAYRAGGTLTDENGIVHDFSRKSGVVWNGILLPEGAPSWMLDRGKLWRAVEDSEKRVDAQLFREVEISIPRELSPRERRQLVIGFVERQFVARGMVADIGIHCPKASDGGEQPHAHVMLCMRRTTAEGFDRKKERIWNDRALLQDCREAWGKACNDALAEAGSRSRVDHRSLAAQGKTREPVGHQGRSVHVRERSVGLEAKRENFLRSHFRKRAHDMVAVIAGHGFAPALPAGYGTGQNDGFNAKAMRMAAGVARIGRQGGYRYAQNGADHARRTAEAIRGEAMKPLREQDNPWGPPGHER